MNVRHSFDEFAYLERPDDWGDAAAALESATMLAVDTEADSMHAYFEKVCLVQLATDADHAFIVDPLALPDLEPLRRPLADPSVMTIFHGADFDVTSLRRDFDFAFGGIFDTMVASQLLGDEKLSLRDLVERFFGVVLEKAHTRANWGKRPLSRDQLEYSYLDVAYLVELAEIQRDRLAEADLLAEAAIEFERLSDREPAVREFVPHGWTRIKGSKRLGPREQAILHELFAARDRAAQKLDRPTFKVLGNEVLLQIARTAPTSRAALRAVKGVSSFAAGRLGDDLLDAVEKGERMGEPPPRPRTALDPARRLDYHSQKRLGRLRDWRNSTADKAGVTTLAILPNYAMFTVARDRPRTPDALAAIPGVGMRRLEKWGDDILRLLR